MCNNKYIVPGTYKSWKIVDQVTAIKHADKTFIHFCSTGVPQKIKAFFDAQNLSYGDEEKLIMINNNKKYSARIKVEKNHNQMKLFIDSSFHEVINKSYTKGDDYPSFLIQWSRFGN
jgi:hypothetical protein